MANSILINIIIGIGVVIGFLIYINRTEGWFKEGGLVYEWWKKIKEEKKDKK